MHTVPGAFARLQALYAEAEQLIDAGDFEPAIAKLDEGIGIDDHFRQRYVTMYALRAFAHQNLGHHELALADYDKAIEMEPEINQAQYYFHRGMCHTSLDNHAQAVEDYGRSIELYPDHPGPYHLRAAALVRHLGRHAEALADIERLIAMNGHPDGYVLRAAVKRQQGDEAGAQADEAEAERIRGAS